MDDGTDHEDWGPPGTVRPAASGDGLPTPASVPVVSLRSALAPPPPPPAPAPPSPAPLVDAVGVVSTGPVSPEPRGSRWIGRVAALGTAAMLVGGGGYLAINAAAADGGADTPQAALRGMFESLSAEDLVGAAEYIEPIERETMIDPSFDAIDELIRLEVFSEDLDLAAVSGIDFDFSDLQIDVTEVHPDLAHIFVDGGRAFASVDGAEFPFGSLITDRVDAETLDIRESDTTQIEPAETPVVAVRRDGRWYLSLWYTVAENARLALDEQLPNVNDRPAAIGGDTPEAAIENLVDAALEVDLAAMIGALDPEEAAALYDYAPLFLETAQAEADAMLAEVSDAGWQWDLTDLELSSERNGGLATVFVESFAFDASGPEGFLKIKFSGDEAEVSFAGGGTTFEMTVEGDCVAMSFDDGYSSTNEDFCGADLIEEAGLESLTEGAFADLATAARPGFVVREVGGRWFVSPLRSGSAATLNALHSIEPEALAETVDGFMEFFEDPFAFGSDPFGSGQSPFGIEDDFLFEEIEPA